MQVKGERFGKYVLLEQLGAGGMGEVYLANLRGPQGFEKLLVVKRLLPELSDNKKILEMFFHEARLAAKLAHPNIAQTFEMGEISGEHYIALEYIHGLSLSEVLKRTKELGERIPPPLVVDIVAQVCDGLHYGHNAVDMSGQPLKLIHRDIKPKNIMLGYAGGVKIIDFGIAKSAIKGQETQAGTIKGSLGYMSPEQITGAVDRRTDIFSLGVCLYQMCAGSNPFYRRNAREALEALRIHTPPPLLKVAPSHAAFDPVVEVALAKDPSRRFDDAREMRRALVGLITSSQVDTSHHNVAEYLETLFSDELTRDQAMVTQALRIAESHSVVAAASDFVGKPDTGSLRLEPPAGAATARSSHRGGGDTTTDVEDRTMVVERGGTTNVSPEAPGSRAAWFIAGFVGVAVLGATVGWGLNRPRARSQVEEIAIASPEDPQPQAAPLRAEPPAQPEPTGQPAPPPPVAAAPEAAPPKAAPPAVAPPKAAPPEAAPPEAVPADVAPAPSLESEPRADAPPAPFGRLSMTTDPPLTVFRGSKRVRRAFRVPSASGTLKAGADPQADPFVVTVHYTVADGAVSYSIDSEPWAIVHAQNGMVHGRTPLRSLAGGGRTVIELVNPRANKRLKVRLVHQR